MLTDILVHTDQIPDIGRGAFEGVKHEMRSSPPALKQLIGAGEHEVIQYREPMTWDAHPPHVYGPSIRSK